MPMALELIKRRAAYNLDRMAVRFFAEDGPETVMCLVTIEALQDHCGLQGSEPGDAVTAAEDHRGLIETAARSKYEARDNEDYGTIWIRSSDIHAGKLRR